MKDLSQSGQYVTNEKVDIMEEKGKLKDVRILGPVRKETQIEIFITDGFVLGVNPPIRDSGGLIDSPIDKIMWWIFAYIKMFNLLEFLDIIGV